LSGYAGKPNHTNMKKFIITTITAVAGVCIANLAVAANTPKTDAGTAKAPKAAPADKKANAPAMKKVSAKDKKFMMNAAKGGMMEVEWGKLAAQNGQHPDVKKFGSRMVTDHSKANNELMALAKEEGVALPAAKSAGKWKSDKDYMTAMVKDHEKDLAEFQEEAKNGTDADLKKFADKTSKIVSHHLQMAREIQGKLK